MIPTHLLYRRFSSGIETSSDGVTALFHYCDCTAKFLLNAGSPLLDSESAQAVKFNPDYGAEYYCLLIMSLMLKDVVLGERRVATDCPC